MWKKTVTPWHGEGSSAEPCTYLLYLTFHWRCTPWTLLTVNNSPKTKDIYMYQVDCHLWQHLTKTETDFLHAMNFLLPPANVVCEDYVFTGVCDSVNGGPAWFYSGGVRGFIRGACVVLFGGHAWFYSGGRGFIRGACMVLFGGACMVLFRGHAWFYPGGMRGFIWGACMVLFGGRAWFYLGGMHGFIWGVCVVLFGGHAWFYLGGMHGFIWGGMHGFSSFFGYNEIRSMSGQYASYWNAFLFQNAQTFR